jgi:hydroxymethylbilane synthase
MGSGSEDMLRRKGHFANYVGDSGDTAEVAHEFAKLANGQTVLFPGSEIDAQHPERLVGRN